MPGYRTDRASSPLRNIGSASGAVLSDDGFYRYRLWRRWDASRPPCVWVMINPSTADARTDDPTIRRVVAFSRAWGFGSIEVFNLFGLRAVSPTALVEHPEPVGPDNDRILAEYVEQFDWLPYAVSTPDPALPPIAATPIVVCAWGVHGARYGRDREVYRLLSDRSVYTYRIGDPTKGGHPRHPLYLPGVLRPQLFVHDDSR